MSTTLVLPGALVAELDEHARVPNESAAVLLVRDHVTASGDTRLLGRSLHWVPQEAYLERTPHEMKILSDGYIASLGLAEETGAIPIWLHTHPVGPPLPSRKDARVEAALGDVFRLRSGSDSFGTVIVSPSGGRLALTGTLQKGRPPRKRLTASGSLATGGASAEHSMPSGHTSSPGYSTVAFALSERQCNGPSRS